MRTSFPIRTEDRWKTLPDPAPLPPPAESGYAPVNGVRIWHASFGTGDPVLLLHGGLASSASWGNQVPALAERHGVIVLDMRGHGRSTRDATPFSYALLADDVLATLDHLKIDRVALVGWSDGGIIGLDIAIKHPERLTKLFAFGANYDTSGYNPEAGKVPVVARAIETAGEDYRKISPTPEEYEAFAGAIIAMWETQPNYRPDELARITTPTMIAGAAYDECIRPGHTEELARLVPGAKLLILPDVSHFAHWQNPALFNRELLAFLDDLGP